MWCRLIDASQIWHNTGALKDFVRLSSKHKHNTWMDSSFNNWLARIGNSHIWPFYEDSTLNESEACMSTAKNGTLSLMHV